jgi:hypothetical protein
MLLSICWIPAQRAYPGGGCNRRKTRKGNEATRGSVTLSIRLRASMFYVRAARRTRTCQTTLAASRAPQRCWGDGGSRSTCRSDVAHKVMAEKTGLCLQMDGPISSYAARVWHTLLNSGVDASIEPPNHTAKRCMWCEMTLTSTGIDLSLPADAAWGGAGRGGAGRGGEAGPGRGRAGGGQGAGRGRAGGGQGAAYCDLRRRRASTQLLARLDAHVHRPLDVTLQPPPKVLEHRRAWFGLVARVRVKVRVRLRVGF